MGIQPCCDQPQQSPHIHVGGGTRQYKGKKEKRHPEWGMKADLGLIVPDVDVPIVQASQHPWLLGVQVQALHPVGASHELAL